MSYSPIATILKTKDKVTKAIKGSVSLKTTRLTKVQEGPISDMEKLLMTWIEDQIQKCIPLSTMMITTKAKSLFATLKEKAGPSYNVEFIASSGLFIAKIHYSMWKWVGASTSGDVKAAEKFLDALDKLIVEENYQSKSPMWMKLPYSGNRCLKALLSIRGPSHCQVSRLLNREQSCLAAMLQATY